jgi:hypothetical protein
MSAAAVGFNERRVKGSKLETVLRLGAGQRQQDPRAAVEWLTDWANNGLLALNAFQGYLYMPRMGTENVRRLLFAPDRSRVAMELGAVLPEPS